MRPTDVPDTGLLCDLLWSDPDKDVQGWGENDRGVSFTFGADVVSKFLNRHDLDLICRAHQVVEDGYEFFAKRQLVTLFSAPNYCGEFDNAGGMMSVDETLMCSFQVSFLSFILLVLSKISILFLSVLLSSWYLDSSASVQRTDPWDWLSRSNKLWCLFMLFSLGSDLIGHSFPHSFFRSFSTHCIKSRSNRYFFLLFPRSWNPPRRRQSTSMVDWMPVDRWHLLVVRSRKSNPESTLNVTKFTPTPTPGGHRETNPSTKQLQPLSLVYFFSLNLWW